MPLVCLVRAAGTPALALCPRCVSCCRSRSRCRRLCCWAGVWTRGRRYCARPSASLSGPSRVDLRCVGCFHALPDLLLFCYCCPFYFYPYWRLFMDTAVVSGNSLVLKVAVATTSCLLPQSLQQFYSSNL